MLHAAYLGQVVAFLASVALLVPALGRLGLSPIIAFLLAGLVAGPYGLGLIHDVEGAALLGEFGIVFLLFTIGLELSVDRLRVMRRDALRLGSAQVVGCAIALGIGAYALTGDPALSFVIGTGLALSSTAAGLRLMADRRLLPTRFGRASLAVLLLQDLAVVPLLIVVPLIAEGARWLAVDLVVALAKAAAALVVIVLVGRLAVRPLFRAIAATRNLEAFAAATLLAALGTAWATESVGLSLSLGAFLAGILLAETEYRHQIEADLRPFEGLLLGLFFASIGMSIDVAAAIADAGAILAIIGAVLAVKMLLILAAARLFGLGLPDAVRTGFLLAQPGEFGFVLFTLAAANGLMAPAMAQRFNVAIAAGILLTPALVTVGLRIAAMFEGRSAAGASAAAEAAGGERVLIAGFGRVGQTVARLLDAAGVPYLAIDLDAVRVAEARAAGQAVIYGDASRHRMLEAAGAEQARLIVVTLDDTRMAERTLAAIRHGFPRLPVVVRARDAAQVGKLRDGGAAAAVPELLEGSLQLGSAVLRAAGTGADDTDRIVDELRRNDYAGIGDVIPAEHRSEPDPAEAAADQRSAR